jgi:hypothetical protein
MGKATAEQQDETNPQATAFAEHLEHHRGLKCDWCRCYPNETHRGGQWIVDRYYCKAHAAFVNGARRVAAILWVSQQQAG